MKMLGLRSWMIGTLALIISLSTLFFTVVLTYVGSFDIFSLVILVVGFNLVQWLFSPYLIDAMYKVKEASTSSYTNLQDVVERLSNRSNINTPRLMIADLPIPNAFAYGSPIAGTRIAVTNGLLSTLEDEEVEAVIGHELGHLKHKDMQIMMFASILPAICYYIGFSLMYSSRYRDENRSSGTALIGLMSILLYWVLTLLSLKLSRLREFYADRHSISVVEDGGRKLSEALAKIVTSTSKMRKTVRIGGNSSLKTLFITDPDQSTKEVRYFTKTDQELVAEILSRKPVPYSSFLELFSTHPNIVKRLKALQELQ